MRGDVAPNEWECRVLVAVADTGGMTDAAELLSERRDKDYHRQSVDKVLKRITQWAEEPLFVANGRRLRPTERGREIVELARYILQFYETMRRAPARASTPVLACLPHHAHLVSLVDGLVWRGSAAQNPEAEDPEAGNPKAANHEAENHRAVVEYLRQDGRSEADSSAIAAANLLTGKWQLMIGPPLRNNRLESTTLYHAQLEAMMGTGFRGDSVPLADLITGHRLLLPPKNMRSRRLLEERVQEWGLHDPHTPIEIVAETDEISNSVMCMNAEWGRPGAGRSCALIAASDVALPFKRGRELGGRYTERFKWVPIVHRDGAGRDHLLQIETCVTTVRNRDPRIEALVQELRGAVERVKRDSAAGLEGALPRFRKRRIPAPRSGGSGG